MNTHIEYDCSRLLFLKNLSNKFHIGLDEQKTYLFINRRNSILLRSGLYPAWLFWLSTRFSCCLKMKSVENILGYVREQFYRFSRGCKPRENLWNCSRKYTEMFKTDSFLGNKKLSFNQNVWRDHATMQQDVLLHFWVIFLHWNQAEIWKKNILLSIIFDVNRKLLRCRKTNIWKFRERKS